MTRARLRAIANSSTPEHGQEPVQLVLPSNTHPRSPRESEAMGQDATTSTTQAGGDGRWWGQ
jgi:hypothetical protein